MDLVTMIRLYSSFSLKDDIDVNFTQYEQIYEDFVHVKFTIEMVGFILKSFCID